MQKKATIRADITLNKFASQITTNHHTLCSCTGWMASNALIWISPMLSLSLLRAQYCVRSTFDLKLIQGEIDCAI